MFYHMGMDSLSFEMQPAHNTSLQRLSQLSDKSLTCNKTLDPKIYSNLNGKLWSLYDI
ncbi:hypothetical protein Hanom_Chr04g00315091 [Helianthus anomalus]